MHSPRSIAKSHYTTQTQSENMLRLAFGHKALNIHFVSIIAYEYNVYRDR